MNKPTNYNLGLAETQQVASVLLNQDGLILQLNEIATGLTGWEAEVAPGMPVDQCIDIQLTDGATVSVPDLLEMAQRQQSGLQASIISHHQSTSSVAVTLTLMLLQDAVGQHGQILLSFIPQLPEDAAKNYLTAKAMASLDWRGSPLAVIRWNTELEAEQWNPGAERIFGYAAEQAIGKKAYDLIIPKHRFEGVRLEFDDLLNVPGGTFGLYENVTADGRRIYCEWHNAPLADADGSVLCVMTLAQDVTERIENQQQLLQSEERFRSYFEQSLTGISIIDPQTGWIDVNQQLCRMLGYSREELLSTNWSNVLPDAERCADLAVLKQFLSGELDQFTNESKRICKDGSIIYVEVNTNVVRAADGKVHYLISQILDITERTIEHRHLDRTLALLISISEALPDLVYFKDREGVYRRVNKAVEKQTALSNDQYVGLTDDDLFPADVAERAKQQDIELMSNPDVDEPLEFESWEPVPGGEPRCYNTRKIIVRDSEERVMGILGISRDITDLKRVQKALSYSHTIIDLTSDMMVLFDRNGYCLSANRAYCQAFAISPERIVGMHWREINRHHPEKHPKIEECHRKCLAGEIVALEMPVTFPGLGACHVAIRLTPYRDETDQINGLVVTIHDISDLRDAGEELRRYEQILSATHDLMSFVTLDYHLAAVNDAYELFSGFKREDVIGKNLVAIYGAEVFYETLKPNFDRCIDGHVVEFEKVVVSPSTQEKLYLEMTYYPYHDAAGVISGVVVCGRDITVRRNTEEDLGRYKDIVSASLDFMAMLDREYRFVAINKRYELYFDMPANNIIGKSVEEFLGDSDLFERVFKPAYDRCLSGEVVTYEQKVPHPTTGEADWAEMRYYPSYGENGAIVGIVVNVRDVTEQKKSELRLKQLSQAVELSPSAVMISDAEGRIEYVNPAFERTSGYSLSEVLGQTPFGIEVYSRSDRNYTGVIEKITSGESWSGELQSQKKTGEIYWENVFFSPIHNDEGEISHYLAVKEDISLRREQEEQLARQAFYDPMTDLPNRMLAFERLRQAMVRADRSGRMVAVIFIDLDHFKSVNDTMGHSYGDQLLIESAKRLKNCIRSEDTVARLGGDEFLVLLTDLVRVETTQPVIDKIIDCFNETFRLGSNEIHVTASVGISIYPNDAQQESDLLRNADIAMYHAKAKGRNRFKFFTEEMDAEAHERLSIEVELRNALERNELFLEYQPVVDGYSGHVVGFEALARWQSPTFGLVPPNKFIPIAEETGLIHEIGLWVLNEACNTLSYFREQGFERLRVAVNVSSKQFQDFGLVDSVKNALEDANIPSYCLALEITETLLLEEREEVTKIIDQLTGIGVQLSVDDFGTGYSSLGYLKKYPFNTLKIDRSFVQNIVDDADDLNLTKAIIAMAHALHLEVIAEGVEDKVQHALLRAESCDFIQGYLISRPIGADALLEFVQQTNR